MTSREIIRRINRDLRTTTRRLDATTRWDRRDYLRGRIAGLRWAVRMLEERQAMVDGANIGAMG